MRSFFLFLLVLVVFWIWNGCINFIIDDDFDFGLFFDGVEVDCGIWKWILVDGMFICIGVEMGIGVWLVDEDVVGLMIYL